VLVIGKRWDPATAFRNTRPYARLFPRATVVTHEGWGHVAVNMSACALAVTTAYLIEPSQPLPDRTCPTDVVPFTDAAARKSKSGQQAPAPVPVLGR